MDSPRFFRDDPEEPFVIVMDTKYMLPTLVWRQHAMPMTFKAARAAYTAIKTVAGGFFGDLYCLRLDSSGEHFYIRARPLESFYKRQE